MNNFISNGYERLQLINLEYVMAYSRPRFFAIYCNRIRGQEELFYNLSRDTIVSNVGASLTDTRLENVI